MLWDLENCLRENRQQNLEYNKSLPGLETLGGFNVKVDDLSFRSAKYLRAFRRHRCNATVEQYYFIRYRITLKYPHLPCIIMRGGNNHVYYFPIEILFVIDYDSVNENVSQMIDCIGHLNI
jgi:hypothetical protein